MAAKLPRDNTLLQWEQRKQDLWKTMSSEAAKKKIEKVVVRTKIMKKQRVEIGEPLILSIS